MLSLFEANLDKRVNGADGDQTTQASNSALNKCVGPSGCLSLPLPACDPPAPQGGSRINAEAFTAPPPSGLSCCRLVRQLSLGKGSNRSLISARSTSCGTAPPREREPGRVMLLTWRHVRAGEFPRISGCTRCH